MDDRISGMKSSRIAVYPASVIPLNGLLAGSLGRRVIELFGFKGATFEGGEAQLSLGSIQVEEDEIVVLDAKMSEKRMVVSVEGTSRRADAVAAVLESLLMGDKPRVAPRVVVYETSCLAKLDFEWGALVSKQLGSFIENTLRPSVENAGARPRVAHAQVALMLKYNTPEDLEQYGISLSHKMFVVGLAPQAPPDDRLYITQSPTKSDEHLRMLLELETMLADKQEVA